MDSFEDCVQCQDTTKHQKHTCIKGQRKKIKKKNTSKSKTTTTIITGKRVRKTRFPSKVLKKKTKKKKKKKKKKKNKKKSTKEIKEVLSYDDETPMELAKRFNWNVKQLLKANRHIKGLRADAKLWEGTKLREPADENDEESESSEESNDESEDNNDDDDDDDDGTFKIKKLKI